MNDWESIDYDAIARHIYFDDDGYGHSSPKRIATILRKAFPVILDGQNVIPSTGSTRLSALIKASFIRILELTDASAGGPWTKDIRNLALYALKEIEAAPVSPLQEARGRGEDALIYEARGLLKESFKALQIGRMDNSLTKRVQEWVDKSARAALAEEDA
jgi:hypothetical protein